jgi:hypothetical protein
MKHNADDVIVNTYYIHFDYFLSCIPIGGKILKLEGSFVTREVYSSTLRDSFLPTLAIKTASEIIISGFRVRCVKNLFARITRLPIKV